MHANDEEKKNQTQINDAKIERGKKLDENSIIFSTFKWDKSHHTTQIIVMHYGIITNMAAIALIHLSIYECIISDRSSSRYREYFFRLFRKWDEKKLFPPFSRAYNNARQQRYCCWLLWLFVRFLFLSSIFLFDWLRRAFLSLNAYTLSLQLTHTHSAPFIQIVKSYSLKTHISHHAFWCRSVPSHSRKW